MYFLLILLYDFSGDLSQAPTPTDPANITASIQKPMISTTGTNPSPTLFPIIAPRVLSLSGTSGMNIANGIPAIKLQSGFSGKPGTFSFRICPPNSEAKTVGAVQEAKPSDSVAGATSSLILPGGFTLIKIDPSPINPVKVNTAANAAVMSLNDQQKAISNDQSSSSEEKCQDLKSSANLPPFESSNSDPKQKTAVDLSPGGNSLSSNDVKNGESMEQNEESVNTLPTEMVHVSKNGEPEREDINDATVEQVLCTKEASEEETCLNTEQNKPDDSAGSPTKLECNSSDLTTTNAVEGDTGSQDETSKNLVGESPLTLGQKECQKNSQASEIIQNQEVLPDTMGKLNTANVNSDNVSKENAAFDVLELRVKEVYTKTAQTFPQSKLKEGDSGWESQIVITKEPCNDETNQTADQDDSSHQSLSTKKDSSAAATMETIDNSKTQSFGPKSCSNPPETLTDHTVPSQQGIDPVHNLPLLNNKEAKNNQTPTVSLKQCLPSKELPKKPLETQLFYTAVNKTVSEHTRNSDEGVHIEPSSLRPAVASRPTSRPPNTAVKATDSEHLFEDESLSEEDSSDICVEDSSSSSSDDTSDSEETSDSVSDYFFPFSCISFGYYSQSGSLYRMGFDVQLI